MGGRPASAGLTGHAGAEGGGGDAGGGGRGGGCARCGEFDGPGRHGRRGDLHRRRERDGRSAKVLSTPADPARAVVEACRVVGVATPTCSPTAPPWPRTPCSSGAARAVALVTNGGLRRRHRDRPPGPAVALRPVRRPPVAAGAPRAGGSRCDGRLAADGVASSTPLAPRRRCRPISATAPRRSPSACCTRPRPRPRGAPWPTRCGPRGYDVTCSHEVSPEFREYERTVTTVVNAYLRPVCRAYLRRLGRPRPARCSVMTSAGGLVAVADAAERPAALLLSGPAGGVRAAAARRRRPTASPTRSPSTWAAPAPTSAWCAAASPSRRPSATVGGLPGPAAVARRAHHRRRRRIDRPDRRRRRAGRRPRSRPAPIPVRPATAGAAPSPPSPTPTSCSAASPPTPRSPRPRPRSTSTPPGAALDRAGVTAEGVVAVVDAAMEQAVRRGRRSSGASIPRGLALVAFGGAGPLHACALAEALGMAAVIVPARAGVLSAVGILAAPTRQRDLVRSLADAGATTTASTPRSPRSRRTSPAQAASARRWRPGADAIEVTAAFDCRYARPEPRAHGRRRSPPSPPSTAAQRLRARRTSRSRSSPLRAAAAAGRRRSPSTTCPTEPRPPAVGPGRDRRARLHDLGAGGLAGRAGRRRRAGAAAGRRTSRP